MALVALVLPLMQGCAGGGGPGAPSAPPIQTGNEALDAALANEIPLEDERPFTSVSGVRLQVPFAFRASIEDQAHRLDITMGSTDTHATCFVYPSSVDLAVALASFGELGNAAIENALGDESASGQLLRVFGGHVEGTPYQGAEWLLVSPKGSAHTKVLAATRRNAGLVCLHVGLGLRQTLLSMFERMVRSLEAPKALREPYLEEIVALRLGGHTIGIEWGTYTLDDDGDTEIWRSSSLFMPRGGTEAAATVSVDRSRARPDGSLIEAISFESDANEVRTNVALRRGDGRWVVSGLYQGKKIEATIAHDGDIDSSLREAQKAERELAPAGPARSASVLQWIASLDPTALFTARMTLAEGTTDEIVLTIDGIDDLVIRGERSESGGLARGTMTQGALEIQMESIHRAGGLLD